MRTNTPPLSREWIEIQDLMLSVDVLEEETDQFKTKVENSPQALTLASELQCYEQQREELRDQHDLAENIYRWRVGTPQTEAYQASLRYRIEKRRGMLQELMHNMSSPCQVQLALAKELEFWTMPEIDLKRSLKSTQHKMDELNPKIGHLKSQRRTFLNQISEKEKQLEQQKEDLETKLRQWTAVNRARLDLFLAHSEKWKEEIVTNFASIHGRESVRDLIDDDTYSLLPSVAASENVSVWCHPDWQMFYAESLTDEKPLYLPPTIDKARHYLKKCLVKDCPSADLERTLQCLGAVTYASPKQRGQMNRLQDEFPYLWRILRVGPKVRALLKIEEEKRAIVFMVRNRKDVYRGMNKMGRVSRKERG